MAQKSSEYWEKRIAASTWKTYNSLEERNRDLLDFYIDASEQVKKELYSIAEKYSKDGVLSLSDMHKQNRLTALNKKLESIIEDLGHKTEESAKKNMQDGFRTVYKDTAVAMGDEDFSMPNKKLMEKLLQEPWRGDSFSGRLWKNQKKLAVGLNDILLTGLQQGKTATEIAVSLHNFMGKEFNECHRLVRTETMHYLNDATLRRYKDAGVEYVQIWAAEDERTCDECSKYHGKIYPIDKCPHVPLHPNCRCTIIPITDDRTGVERIQEKQEGITPEKSAMNAIVKSYERRRKSGANYTPAEEIMDSFSADFTGMYSDLAERSSEQFGKLANKYRTTCTNIHVGKLENPTAPAGTEFSGVTQLSEITFNRALVKDRDQFLERMKRAVERKQFPDIPESKYEEYLVTHEFFHTLMDFESKLKNSVGIDMSNVKKSREELRMLHSEYKKTILDVSSDQKKAEETAIKTFDEKDWEKAQSLMEKYEHLHISKYADMSVDEFCAEGFAEALLSDNPSPYSESILKIVNKYFKWKEGAP